VRKNFVTLEETVFESPVKVWGLQMIFGVNRTIYKRCQRSRVNGLSSMYTYRVWGLDLCVGV